MKILVIIPKPITGVEYHRLLMPFDNLGEGYEVTSVEMIDHQPDTFLQQFDLIYTSSVVSKFGQQEILWAQIKRLGVPVIIDRDDDWQLPHDHLMKRDWVQNKTAEQIVYNLKMADAVTVPTEYLAQKVKQYNPNVFIIPNAIDFNQQQFKPDQKVKDLKTDKVHIGWSGSVTHFHDVMLLTDTFMQLNSNPDTSKKYRVVLSGYTEGQQVWEEYQKIFTSGYKIAEDQYCRINGMDVYTYASAYDLMDVGLIPLKDTEFNRCKSELKMMEMGAKKLPVIVSNQYPYTNISKHGINCLTANKKDWFKNIKRLIDSKDLREDLGEALYEEIFTNFNILKVNELRKELFNYVTRKK
jgi:processive 1,2-diacylglycerol beta-glucosyltransferase